MMLVGEIAIVGTAALAVAAVAMLLARCCGVRPRAAWALGAGLGYVAGHATMVRASGWSPALAKLLEPGEARDWLPLVVLAAAGITVYATYAPHGWGRQLAVLMAALLVVGGPMRLLAGSVFVVSEWSGTEKAGHLALLAGILAAIWALLAAARDDDVPGVRAGLLLVVALGSAAVLAMSGVAIYGELCGVVAAAIGGAAIGEWVQQNATHLDPKRQRDDSSPTAIVRVKGGGPRAAGQEALAEPEAHETRPLAHASTVESGIGGTAGVVTLSLGSLVLLGHYFAELTAANAALLGVAAVAAAGWLPAAVTSWPKLAAVIRTVVCLAAVGWAIARCLATSGAAAPTSPYSM